VRGVQDQRERIGNTVRREGQGNGAGSEPDL
jgi:hypothetical protein